MSDHGHYIKVYDNFLPSDLCRRIIKRFDDNADQVVDWRTELPVGSGFATKLGSCLDVNLNRYQSIWADIEAELLHYYRLGVRRYMSECPGCHFPTEWGWEAIRVKRYLPENKDHFVPHTDTAILQSARRYLGAFFFLNNVEVGGETIFPHYNVSIKPMEGRMFLFPPYWMYVHAGIAPVSGPRYLVGTYLHLVEGADQLIAIPEEK